METTTLTKKERDKVWRENNREKLLQYYKDHYQTNKERIKKVKADYRLRTKDHIKAKSKMYYGEKSEIIKAKVKKYAQDNKEKIRVYKREYGYTLKSRFLSYQNSALKRNKTFELDELTFCEIMISDCTYCGTQPAYGVDRKENAVGYTKENSVPCCKICNYMKKEHDYEFFKAHIKKMYEKMITLA